MDGRLHPYDLPRLHCDAGSDLDVNPTFAGHFDRNGQGERYRFVDRSALIVLALHLNRTDTAFAKVRVLYIDHAKDRKLSWKTDEGYLNRPKAKFGKRAASSITKRELLDHLEEIAHASKSSANRTQSTLRTLWGWAAERDYVPMNFLAGVKKVGGKEAEKNGC